MIAAMLQFLNRASQSIFMRGLFAILLFAFIIFGIGDVLRSRGGSDEVALVGHERISPQQLSDLFKRQLDRIGRQMGGKVDPATAIRSGFLNKTLDALVNDMLMGLAAHDRGFLVGDKLVVEKIEETPYFQDPATHLFDREIFRRILAQQGISEGDEIRSEKLDYSKQLLAESELGAVTAPAVLRDAMHRFQDETRRGLAIYISSAGMTVPTPTVPQLTDYYTKHPVNFTAPEARDFSFLYVDAADLAKSIKPTDEDLKQAYDSRQNEFQVPERRDLSQAILPDKAKAEQVAAEVRAGKTLAVAAKSAGSTDQPFDLGLMARQDLPEALQQPVFSAPADGVVPPVKTELGWHVIVVHRIEPPRQLTFDEARHAVETDVKEEKARDMLAETARHIDDSLAGGASLAEAGKPYGLVPVAVKNVEASGRHPDGTAVSELMGKGALIRPAFAMDKDAPTQMTQEGSAAYALTIDKIVAPSLKPFDSVKGEVSKDYIADAKERAADALGAKLLKMADSGTPFASLAAQANAIVTPVGPFAHAAGEHAESAPIVAALFDSTEIGQTRLAALKNGPALIQLSEIIAPPPLPSGEQVALDKTIERQMQGDFLSQYEQALRVAYPVKINRTVLDRMKTPN